MFAIQVIERIHLGYKYRAMNHHYTLKEATRDFSRVHTFMFEYK